MKTDILHQFWAVRRQLEREKAAKQYRVVQIDRALSKIKMMMYRYKSAGSGAGTLGAENSANVAATEAEDLVA